MKLGLACLALVACPAAVLARSDPPLRNPALLNIGYVCQWQERCMDKQEGAMKRSLKFVKKYQPPSWKVQLCNRNAGRNGTRVDWVGYYNCIRNPDLEPPPPPRKKRRR